MRTVIVRIHLCRPALWTTKPRADPQSDLSLSGSVVSHVWGTLHNEALWASLVDIQLDPLADPGISLCGNVSTRCLGVSERNVDKIEIYLEEALTGMVVRRGPFSFLFRRGGSEEALALLRIFGWRGVFHKLSCSLLASCSSGRNSYISGTLVEYLFRMLNCLRRSWAFLLLPSIRICRAVK